MHNYILHPPHTFVPVLRSILNNFIGENNLNMSTKLGECIFLCDYYSVTKNGKIIFEQP